MRLQLSKNFRVYEILNSDRDARAIKARFLRPLVREILDGREFSESLRKIQQEDREIERFFDFSATGRPSRWSLRDEWLYPKIKLPLTFFGGTDRAGLSGHLKTWCIQESQRNPKEMLNCAADLISGRFTAKELRRRNQLLDERTWPLFERLIEPAADAQFDFSSPGIYRLQHACLFLKTKRAGVLIDPHFQTFFEPWNLGLSIATVDLFRKSRAVVISHAHQDHYSPASLLAVLPKDAPIFVPATPKNSVVSPRIANELRLAGFSNVRALRWGECETIEDIEIHALPFFGEQATSTEQPMRSDLFNFGNTYLIKSPDFSIWCLVDSGTDVRGSPIELASQLVKEHGEIDALASNVRDFKASGCAGNNWFSLTGWQLARFRKLGPQTTTLGYAGISELCRATGARHFLPYAHFWAHPGTRPIGERKLLEGLRAEFKNQRVRTKIEDWRIGERHFNGYAHPVRRAPEK